MWKVAHWVKVLIIGKICIAFLTISISSHIFHICLGTWVISNIWKWVFYTFATNVLSNVLCLCYKWFLRSIMKPDLPLPGIGPFSFMNHEIYQYQQPVCETILKYINWLNAIIRKFETATTLKNAHSPAGKVTGICLKPRKAKAPKYVALLYANFVRTDAHVEHVELRKVDFWFSTG